MDFSNTVVVMTSNVGAKVITDRRLPLGFSGDAVEDGRLMRAQVREELRQTFKPEFLNRLDETILFRPLTKENLNGIIDIMVASLRSRLADRSLGLTITDSAKSLIIDRGFDPLYGARPLRRYLQSSVETLIARRILSGDVAPESTIVVDAENGELVCR